MDSVIGLIFGFILGFVICSWIFYGDINKQLKECQRSLPRDQYCKIIAVPEKSGNE